MSLRSPRFAMALVALTLPGCAIFFDDDDDGGPTFDAFDTRDAAPSDTAPSDTAPPPISASGEARWGEMPADDPLIAILFDTPNARQRVVPDFDRLMVAVTSRRHEVTILSVARLETGEVLALEDCDRPIIVLDGSSEEHCAIVPPADPLREGERLAVTYGIGGGASVLVLEVPPRPTGPDAFHALVALVDEGGTAWAGTAHHGLVGVGADGAVVRYAGIASTEPYDASYRGPQSALVMALEPDEDAGGMWLGTATTGVSWFDPGVDPIAPDDDRWVHAQPVPEPEGLGRELAQTPVALAPDVEGVWAATVNGLWRARWNEAGTDLHFLKVADGAAFAVAIDDAGRTWAGFTTQIDEAALAPAAPDPSAPPDPNATPSEDLRVTWPQAEGALVVVGEQGLTWALPTEDVVTAVLPRGDEVWLGTARGILRARLGSQGVELVPTGALELVPAGLAVTHLAPAAGGGFWLAARDECGVRQGVLRRIDLDVQGEIVRVVDFSDRGFGERNFSFVRERPDGRVLVSTLVPTLLLVDPRQTTSSGCEPAEGSRDTADLYVLDAREGGGVWRFGEAR